ncbi:winged helix-turn-helix transcriptional regulator [Planctomycetes bacterium K23_9]|uniref:Putative HTH-type transcriptional regulator YybR n=1 Tax=Stieleria marina TaxID=1930275 RepID=A0A517NWN4_9BACT|nr:putative HTH-type transcriptional regulator YybR [Planctomycetes bacterium K23_9]
MAKKKKAARPASKRATKPASKPCPTRRSPCPIACTLDVIGDRWTLLVVRDLFLGRTRFKEFTASPESIPTNILSERLQRLLQSGVIKQVPASDGSKRLAYELTDKGDALRPLIKAVTKWGLQWEEGTRIGMTPLEK